MKTYTVILMCPDYVAENYGEDAHVVLVHADSVAGAIEKAQLFAARTDLMADGEDDQSGYGQAALEAAEDYRVIAVFAGFHPDIKEVA